MNYIAFIYSRPPINACYDCDRKINELRAFLGKTAKRVLLICFFFSLRSLGNLFKLFCWMIEIPHIVDSSYQIKIENIELDIGNKTTNKIRFLDAFQSMFGRKPVTMWLILLLSIRQTRLTAKFSAVATLPTINTKWFPFRLLFV